MKDFFEWLKTATWHKLLLAAVSALVLIVLYTVYENRQRVYERVVAPMSTGDLVLAPPSETGVEMFRAFAKRHPSLAMITVIDADPIKNKRTPVYRFFNNNAVKQFVTQQNEDGNDGSGLLYGVDADSNRHTLAILSAQVICDDASKGFFAKVYPGVDKLLGYSCRVPIPPLYGLTTGWLAMHFIGPMPDNPQLTMELLNLAIDYYKVEIVPKERK